MIHFHKYHANSNDFMIVHMPANDKMPIPAQARKLANRNTGVGFDQLLWLSPHPRVDAKLEIFNPDGSRSQQCGNGVCCAASFLRDQGLCQKDELTLALGKQKALLRLLSDGKVVANLGTPSFKAKEIPYCGEIENDRTTLDIAGTRYQVGLVNLGNPHAVIVFPDSAKAPLKLLGEELKQSASFPQGVNVICAQILSPTKISARVYERGAGETLACGSGGCAAVIIGRKWQLLERRVRVIFPGGAAEVFYRDDGGVEMIVSPSKVFSGILRL